MDRPIEITDEEEDQIKAEILHNIELSHHDHEDKL